MMMNWDMRWCDGDWMKIDGMEIWLIRRWWLRIVVKVKNSVCIVVWIRMIVGSIIRVFDESVMNWVIVMMIVLMLVERGIECVSVSE